MDSDADRPVRALLHDTQMTSGGPGLIMQETGAATMKAPEDGVYELGAGRFKVMKGGDIPTGGVFKAKDAPAAKTYDVPVTSAGYQEAKPVTGTAKAGASGKPAEYDGEAIAQALKAAGYWLMTEEEMQELENDAELTLEQKAEKAKAKADEEAKAKLSTGPTETTLGTGPTETPEASGPLTERSATAKPKNQN